MKEREAGSAGAKQQMSHRATVWLLCLGILWLTGEYFLLGKYSYVPLGDNSELIIPALISLRYAGIADPGWNPMVTAGADVLSSAIATPFNIWLYGTLPGWLAFQLVLVGSVIAAVLSLFLLCRRLNFTRDASVAAALLYASTLNLNLVQAAIGFLPAVILALTMVLERPRHVGRWIFLAGITFVASQTAWFSNVFPFASVCLIAWFIFVDPRISLREWLIISLIVVVLPLSRIDDFMALRANLTELMLQITRPPLKIQWIDAVDFIFGFPMRCVVVGSAALAFLTSRFSNWRLNWLTLGIVLVLLAPPLGNMAQALLARWLDQELRGFRLVKFSSIAVLMCAVALGYGLHQLTTSRMPRWVSKTVFVALGSVLIVSTGHDKIESLLKDWLNNGSYVRNFESPAIRKMADIVRSEGGPVRVEPIFAYAGHLHSYGIETLSGDHPFIGRRFYEFWAAIQEPWIERGGGALALWPELEPLFTETGPWPPYRREKLTLVASGTETAHNHTLRPLDAFYRTNLLSFANVKYFISREPLSGEGITLLHDPGVIWAKLSINEKARINFKENFKGRENLYIYRNNEALPRFFTPERVEALPTGRAVVERIAALPAGELQRLLVVERDVLPPTLSTDRGYAAAVVTLRRYTSDAIELDIATDGDAILVVTNTYSPYWVCLVDGKPIPIFPAYRAFWGAHLPAGSRSVKLQYSPPYRRIVPLL